MNCPYVYAEGNPAKRGTDACLPVGRGVFQQPVRSCLLNSNGRSIHFRRVAFPDLPRTTYTKEDNRMQEMFQIDDAFESTDINGIIKGLIINEFF